MATPPTASSLSASTVGIAAATALHFSSGRGAVGWRGQKSKNSGMPDRISFAEPTNAVGPPPGNPRPDALEPAEPPHLPQVRANSSGPRVGEADSLVETSCLTQVACASRSSETAPPTDHANDTPECQWKAAYAAKSHWSNTFVQYMH